MKTFKEQLEAVKACEPACDWALAQTSDVTAWSRCTRGDWMLWLLSRLPALDQGKLAEAAMECAKTDPQRIPGGSLEDVPLESRTHSPSNARTFATLVCATIQRIPGDDDSLILGKPPFVRTYWVPKGEDKLRMELCAHRIRSIFTYQEVRDAFYMLTG